MIILIIILIVIVSLIVAVISNKLSNKMHKTFMRATGLGDALNSHYDKKNAEVLEKLEVMLQEGKITQEQYERRKKHLMQDFDFNE